MSALNPLPTVTRQLPKTQADWDQVANTLQQWISVLQGPKWQAPTLLNSWANYGSGFTPAGYMLDGNGRVWLRGMVASGVGATIAFTLPWTVPYDMILSTTAVVSSSQIVCYAKVFPNGDVMPSFSGTATWFSLDGLSFDLRP